MSDESTLPPSEEPPDDPSAPSAEDNGNEQDWLPKVKRRHRKGDPGGDIGEASERDILVLCSLLLTNLLDKRNAGPVSLPAEARAKANRFTGKTPLTGVLGVAAADPPLPATAPPPAAGGGAAPALPGSPQIRLKPRTAEGASREGQWNTGTTWEKIVAYLMVALVLAAFVYFVGRRVMRSAALAHSVSGGQAAALPTKPAAFWTPMLMAQLDAVLTADQNGDLKNARQLALELKKRLPDSPDLDLYLATLQIRNGDFNKAEDSVSKMNNGFTPPLLAAAISENLGFNYARKRDLPLAISAFADAAAADPLNATHFYHWGEALRRKGQLQEAITHFNEALKRLPPGLPRFEGERAETEFKINLTQIELGDDAGVQAAIADHLKNGAPTGYWLLTAAAYALQHGDMAAAADDLKKARGAMSADSYTVLTNDYFLHGFSEHGEVSALLNIGASAHTQLLQTRMGYFIDP